MASKPLKLGSLNFKTKSAATIYLKKLLNSVALDDGESMCVDIACSSILLDLLAMHPRLHEKIPDFPHSVAGFSIRRFAGGNQFCYILRGGHPEPFSYKKCLMPKQSYHKHCVVDAFRTLVRDDCDKYKRDRLQGAEFGVCEISGLTFPSDELVVDHWNPFSSILADFMRERKLGWNDVCISYVDSNDKGINFIVGDIAKQFRDWHKAKARLCLIHRDLNSALKDMIKEGPAFEFAVKAFASRFEQSA